ncbi:MAG: VCBS repeat-containing protein [Pseudomonadota bacterium]
MTHRAPRQQARWLHRLARGGLLPLVLATTPLGPGWADGLRIAAAEYVEPTTRYTHLVLGKDFNWGGLDVQLSDGSARSVRLERYVFEDTAPRIVDLDSDGSPEIITVEASSAGGARLAVYGIRDGEVVAMARTPPIGTSHRWLAVVGAADFDSDGFTEIAYVDRPHLAKTLRLWRYRSDLGSASLEPLASLPGVTNHRIGDPHIVGGVRVCEGEVPEMRLASANWARLLSVKWQSGGLVAVDLGPYPGDAAVEDGLACP